MFRGCISQTSFENPDLAVKGGLILEKSRVYLIPPGATHIGVRAGILRFLYPQNEKLPISKGFFRSKKNHWRYWPVPNGAKKVSFPALVEPVIYEFNLGPTSWAYGEPRFY